ncbi:MAG: hypothetical protein LBP61_03735 [Desulfovibrio sp.]|jgi:hypothetical protein|nr:hypothetical protein [Desulfovibrio sp.]
MWWDQAASYAGKGFSSGWSTGSGIANAQYNAKAYEIAAESLENQAGMQSWLVRKQYESEYRQLVSSQERQAAMNQVVAAKRGIAGDSANAAMQSYAMKGQRNLERLYYNAAMKTGQETMQIAGQAAALREKSRQYSWQAKSILIKGVIGLAAGFKDYQTNTTQNNETSGARFRASRKVPTAAKNQVRAWGALACVYLGLPVS